jgi:hypothetical protein
MEAMQALIASGRIVDLILVIMAANSAWLLLARRAQGWDMREIACTMLPGAFILLALRAALVGEPWTMVAFWLLMSLPAHLYDIWRKRA